MATSKTDIQQSVGRILREKHSNPIIVDIVDTHDIFKSQWNKRKAFYRKEDYKIFYTNSDAYEPDVSKWEPIEYKKRGKKNIQIDDDTDDKYKPIGVCLLKMKK